jgi:hypothetical protein
MMPSSDEVAMSGCWLDAPEHHCHGGDRRVERFDNLIEYEQLYRRLRRRKRSRAMILSRLRSAVSPIVDRRTQLDRLRDPVEERASLAA